VIKAFILTMFLQQCVLVPDGTGNFTTTCPTSKTFVDQPNNDMHPVSTNPGIGHAQCLPEVLWDLDRNARPSRPPNTLFPGDTGCDIGAYQYVGTPGTTTVTISVKAVISIR
jgi:hypothetical protein